MALTFYDIPGGASRDLTQADLDELMVIRASHGRIMAFLSEERSRLVIEISNARAIRAPIDTEVPNNAN